MILNKNNSLLNKCILFLIFIIIIVLLFIVYKSEIFFHGSMRSYYSIYYKICFILLFLLITSFFLKKNYKIYLIIIILSVSFSIYIFEIFLSYKLYVDHLNLTKNRDRIFFELTNKKFDKRKKHEIFNDLIKTNNNTALVLTRKLYNSLNSQIYPLGNISFTQTINCNENGYYSVYNSDRFGFNNPDDEWSKKEIEYFVLGDSAVHGACVNRPHDISSHLRKISNKSVLNVGYNGNGPLIEFASLREYLPKNTKKVIWFYYENDSWDLKRELDTKFLLNYLTENRYKQNLKEKQSEIDYLLKKELKNLILNTKIYQKKYSHEIVTLIKLLKLENARRFIFTPKIQPEFTEILKKANQEAIQNNSEFYFVYIPGYHGIKNNVYGKNFGEIEKILKELNIPLINIKEKVFDKMNDPLKLFPFGLRGHYNEEGFKQVALAVYQSTQ